MLFNIDDESNLFSSKNANKIQTLFFKKLKKTWVGFAHPERKKLIVYKIIFSFQQLKNVNRKP